MGSLDPGPQPQKRRGASSSLLGLRKEVLRRFLLAENDEESVAAFAEKLNMKDACYMLAEAWDSLERQNLKNACNRL
ncbi:hypothetical protein TNCV_3957651 [Trichonephila clavipes]|nr:hypothetical protein TNCV_3957651 [Trichonephila clavipes]